MLLIISRNEDRPELESKILAAAFRQSVERGDIDGSRLAHRELVGLLARKSQGARADLSGQVDMVFASDNVQSMELQALVRPDKRIGAPAPPAENGAHTGDGWQDMSPEPNTGKAVMSDSRGSVYAVPQSTFGPGGMPKPHDPTAGQMSADPADGRMPDRAQGLDLSDVALPGSAGVPSASSSSGSLPNPEFTQDDATAGTSESPRDRSSESQPSEPSLEDTDDSGVDPPQAMPGRGRRQRSAARPRTALDKRHKKGSKIPEIDESLEKAKADAITGAASFQPGQEAEEEEEWGDDEDEEELLVEPVAAVEAVTPVQAEDDEFDPAAILEAEWGKVGIEPQESGELQALYEAILDPTFVPSHSSASEASGFSALAREVLDGAAGAGVPELNSAAPAKSAAQAKSAFSLADDSDAEDDPLAYFAEKFAAEAAGKPSEPSHSSGTLLGQLKELSENSSGSLLEQLKELSEKSVSANESPSGANETVAELVHEPEPEPVSKPMPESMPESVAESEPASMPEPVLQPMPESMPEPVLQPMPETMQDSVEAVAAVPDDSAAKEDNVHEPSLKEQVEPQNELSAGVDETVVESGVTPAHYLDFNVEDSYEQEAAKEAYSNIDFGDTENDSSAGYAVPDSIAQLLSQRPVPEPEAASYYPWISAENTDPFFLLHVCYLRAVRRLLLRQSSADKSQALVPQDFKKQLRNMGVAYNILFDARTRLDYDLRQLGLREPDRGNGLTIPDDAKLPEAGGKVRLAFSELLIVCRIFAPEQMLAIVNAARLLSEQRFWLYLAESALLTEVELDSIKSGFQLICNGLISITQFEQAFQYVRLHQQQLLEILLAAGWVRIEDLHEFANAPEREEMPEAPKFVEANLQRKPEVSPQVQVVSMPSWMEWGGVAESEVEAGDTRSGVTGSDAEVDEDEPLSVSPNSFLPDSVVTKKNTKSATEELENSPQSETEQASSVVSPQSHGIDFANLAAVAETTLEVASGDDKRAIESSITEIESTLKQDSEADL